MSNSPWSRVNDNEKDSKEVQLNEQKKPFPSQKRYSDYFPGHLIKIKIGTFPSTGTSAGALLLSFTWLILIKQRGNRDSSSKILPLLRGSVCKSEPARKQPFPYPLQQADGYFNWYDFPLLNVVLNEFSILWAWPFPFVSKEVASRKVRVAVLLKSAKETGTDTLELVHMQTYISQHYQPHLSLYYDRKIQEIAACWWQMYSIFRMHRKHNERFLGRMVSRALGRHSCPVSKGSTVTFGNMTVSKSPGCFLQCCIVQWDV